MQTDESLEMSEGRGAFAQTSAGVRRFASEERAVIPLFGLFVFLSLVHQPLFTGFTDLSKGQRFDVRPHVQMSSSIITKSKWLPSGVLY